MDADSLPIEPAQARALKEEGNRLYLAGKFEAALDKYNRAVNMILELTNYLPLTLIQRISAVGYITGSTDTVLFYAHALTAFPFRISSIPAFCDLLKFAEDNGEMETGLWLLGVLCRKTRHIHDIPKDDTVLISQVLEHYKKALPDQVEQCLSAPEQSALHQELQVLLSRRALERCSSAVNSFRGDCEQMPQSVPTSSASAPATVSRTVQLTELGDRDFIRENHAAAVARWREALSGFVLLQNLLNNLAQICTRMKTEQSSLQLVLEVLAVQPSNAKACARAATIALHAGWLQASADCAAHGLRHSPAHPDLLRIKQQAWHTVILLSGHSDTTAGTSSTPPKGRGMHARASLTPDHNVPDPRAMQRRVALEQLTQQEPQKLRSIERHAGLIPDDFCESFLGGQVLPAGCKRATVSKILFEGSERAFAAWETLSSASPGAISTSAHGPGTGSQHSNPGDLGPTDPMQFAGEGFLAERLIRKSPARLRWFKDAPIGALNYVKCARYPDDLLASFTDVVQHALAIPAAGTHVDVGFVDLGELAGTVVLHQSASAQTDPKSAPDPDIDGAVEVLRWVGIDQSAFCCARTLVILKMMFKGVDSHEIVQVWYSAGWSSATLHAFHACVAALLEEPSGAAATLTAEVRRWLQAWHGTTVPLATARATWADRVTKSQAWIGNLSADNGKDSKLEVSTGSVVMFPDSTRGVPRGRYACNESFLYVVPPEELIAERLQGNNLLLAAAVCVRRRVDALARALRAKHVTCEVWHTWLAPDTLPEIERVRALEPTSMSWSSFFDFGDPSALITLLRSCAKPGCPHFMHSLNWVLDVKGSFIMDYGYPATSSKKGVAQAKERMQVWEDAQRLVREEVKGQRAERLMRVQPLESPSYVCDVLLAQRMLPKWLEGLTSIDEYWVTGSGVTFEVLHAPELY